MFFKKLVNEKHDKVKFDNIPKINEEYVSVVYGCVRFFDNYRFLSSSLNWLVRTLVDNNHKTPKTLKKENVEYDELLNIVNEIEDEDRTIEDLTKDYPNEIENLEEALLNSTGDIDLKFLNTDFPDK